MPGTEVNRLINAWQQRSAALSVPGCHSRIWREGEGEAVLCLHGVPASAWLYRKMLPALASEGLEGIAVDLPGMGLADRPRHLDYSWSGLSAWLAEAARVAGLSRFHLVVHDIAGPVGFDLVRRVPDRILSLTVLNTMVDVSQFHRPWMMEPFAHSLTGWPWVWGARAGLFIPLMRATGVLSAVPLDELLVYPALLGRQDGGAAFLKIMRGFERNKAFETRIKAALAARRFPAQVIWGAQDPALKESRYAPSVINALSLPAWQSVPGKHFVQEDSPGAIAQAVAQLARSANEGIADRSR